MRARSGRGEGGGTNLSYLRKLLLLLLQAYVRALRCCRPGEDEALQPKVYVNMGITQASSWDACSHEWGTRHASCCIRVEHLSPPPVVAWAPRASAAGGVRLTRLCLLMPQEAEGLLMSACEYYRQAVGLNPEHYRAYKLMGSALYALGDFAGARAALIQSLRSVAGRGVVRYDYSQVRAGVVAAAPAKQTRECVGCCVHCIQAPRRELTVPPSADSSPTMRTHTATWAAPTAPWCAPRRWLACMATLLPCKSRAFSPCTGPVSTSISLLEPTAQGDVSSAKRAFKAAIATCPTHLEAHFNMGNLYRQCAEFARAVQRCARSSRRCRCCWGRFTHAS